MGMNGKVRLLGEDIDTFEMASKMIGVYDEAKKYATGSPRVRRIVRMQAVVKEVIEEFVTEVERAEQESE